MNKFKLDFLVEEESLLRDFLAKKEISKRTLTAVKYDGGKLLVNEIERDVRHVLSALDQVRVVFPPEKLSENVLVENGELDIIYEDEAILLIQKPAGKSTIPSSLHRTGTIANYVAGKFKREAIPATVHIVTRLDYDTSGLLCVAKNRHIHHLLGQKISKGNFKRQYEAIVEGHIEQEKFMIDKCIGRKDGSIIERVVRSDGQEARTSVRVLKRFERNGEPYTHIALSLDTGRTHQIRVHMQWLGHPLVGDDLYGGRRNLINRQALHCAALSFQHPVTEKEMLFRSNLPVDIKGIFP